MFPRGLLICLEGLDRTGKTTQTAKLLDRLRHETGQEVILQKFPDRSTGIGGLIDRYLRKEEGGDLDDCAVHLLFSGNRWERRDAILSALNSGKHVLLDRYIMSGIAFSVAKGLDFNWCRSPDVGLPLPDITIVLELKPEDAEKRGGYGGERYEVPKLQKEVAKVFKELGGVHIDAAGTVEEVAERIWGEVGKVLEGERGELRKFE